jgi:phage FluMu protein Com
MDIQFRCNSISHFDQKTGRYVHCGHLLTADAQQTGLRIRCPRCKQYSVVPAPVLTEASAKTGSTDRGVARPGASREPPETDGSLSYSAFDRKTRCRKCGALLDAEGKCTACYFVAPALLPATTPIDQIPIQPAGFQLWFRNIMTSGVGVAAFEFSMHALVGFVLLTGVIMGVLFAGAASGAVIVGAILLGLFYGMIVWQTRRLARVPAARLPFYFRPLWYGILVLARQGNWQRYDSTLVGRVIIDVRGRAFGDRDLLELDNLAACQVLDAEGTDLTDSGLALMHGLKHLRCLVIRKTHVTPEGVFRLQQAIPRCWIWY